VLITGASSRIGPAGTEKFSVPGTLETGFKPERCAGIFSA